MKMNQEQQQLYEKLLKKVNEYCLGYAAEDVIAAIDALVENYDKSQKALEILERYVYKIEKYDTEYWIFFDGMEGENADLSKEEYELLKEVLK